MFPEAREQLERGYLEITTQGRVLVERELFAILERPNSVESYFCFSGSPLVSADDTILGNYFIVTETTREVIARRRLGVIRVITECTFK